MGSTSGNEPTRTGFEPSSFLRSLVETTRAVILDPARFFRGLDRSPSSGNAIIFAVVCSVVSIVLAALTAPLNPFVPGGGWLPDGWLVVTLVLSPLLAWIGLYIVAAVQHLFVMIFVRPRKGFDATLRVNAYASALALLSWVPVVGYLASLYALYVTMVGIKELHETSTRRAMLALVVPLLLFLANAAWSLSP